MKETVKCPACGHRFIDGDEERWGCHVDLDPEMYPDGCVFDEDRIPDCREAEKLANVGKGKTDCPYWRKW